MAKSNIDKDKENTHGNGIGGFDDFEVDSLTPGGGEQTVISGKINDETARHMEVNFRDGSFNNNKILALLSGSADEVKLARLIIKSKGISEITVTNNIILLTGKRGSGKTSHNNAFKAKCIKTNGDKYNAESELFSILRFAPPAQVAQLGRVNVAPNAVAGYFYHLEMCIGRSNMYTKQTKGTHEYEALTFHVANNLFIAHSRVVRGLIQSLTGENDKIKTLHSIKTDKDRVDEIHIPVTMYTEARDGIYENTVFYTDVQLRGYGDSMEVIFSINRLQAVVNDISEKEIGKIIDEIKVYVATLKNELLKNFLSEEQYSKIDPNEKGDFELFSCSVVVEQGFTAQIRVSFYYPYESILILAGTSRSLKVVSYDENMPMGSFIDEHRDDKSTTLKGGLSKLILYKPSKLSTLFNAIDSTVTFELRDDGENKDVFLGINADILYFEYDGRNTRVTNERLRSRFVTKTNLISNGALYSSVFDTLHATTLSTQFINDLINSKKFPKITDKIKLLEETIELSRRLVDQANKYSSHINFNENIIKIIGAADFNSDEDGGRVLHTEFVQIANDAVTSLVGTKRQLDLHTRDF